MIFRAVYVENKELKQEVEFYSRENWRKEQRIREGNKKIKELEKQIEDLEKELEGYKNETNTKRKSVKLPRNK